MSLKRIRTATPIKTSLLIAASILLLGALTMAFGFFGNHFRVTYLGILITAITSWATLLIAFTSYVRRRLSINVALKARDPAKMLHQTGRGSH